MLTNTLWVKNFAEIALSHTVFEIQAFCLLRFLQKFKNSKWPPFLAGQNIFENWVTYSEELPCGSKIASKLLYLAQFSSIFENMKRIRLMAVKLWRKENADPADLAELLLPYINKHPSRDA